MTDPKVKPNHLLRIAIIYVRQSSPLLARTLFCISPPGSSRIVSAVNGVSRCDSVSARGGGLLRASAVA